MGRCCDGRNAYSPITKIRYLAGLVIFWLFHLQCKILLFLRKILFGKSEHYEELRQFHRAYFKDTLKEILKKKGMKLKETTYKPNFALKIKAALVILLLVFSYYLLRFQGPVKGYWDTYITVPAMLITNQHVDFVTKEGNPLYSYTLPGKLPDNLINKSTYGISSKDQRLGSAIFTAPWTLFFNISGFRISFAIQAVLISLFVYLTVFLLTRNTFVSAFTCLCATFNSYILSINTMNPNIMGMSIISMLIYLLIKQNPQGFIIGLIYGILGGIRNEAILFAPAIIYKLYVSSDKKTKEISLFFLAAFIGILPILYWNAFAFGNPFMHPTQFRGLDGFRPEFGHKFLFWKFNFNGMLNYPFHSKIIRTPCFAFPVFILLPLTLINSFGILLSSLMLTGSIRMLKKYRQVWIFLFLWFMPMFALLSVQENWSDLKTTFILMCFNPLILCMSIGIERFFVKKHLLRYTGAILLISFVLSLAVSSARNLNFEEDSRWYKRFPRAIKGTNFSFIGDDLRTKFEAPEELVNQKNRLTKANFLPRIDFAPIDSVNTLKTIFNEFGTKEIKTVDFWKYIYEK